MATVIIGNLASLGWEGGRGDKQKIKTVAQIWGSFDKIYNINVKNNGKLEVHVFAKAIVFNRQLSRCNINRD